MFLCFTTVPRQHFNRSVNSTRQIVVLGSARATFWPYCEIYIFSTRRLCPVLIVQHNKSIVIPRDSRLDLYNMRLAHKSISNIIRCPLDIPARAGPGLGILYFVALEKILVAAAR